MGWTDTHSNSYIYENRDAKTAGNIYAIAANAYSYSDGNADNDAGDNDNAFTVAFAN